MKDSGRSVKDLEETTNTELEQIQEWFQDNELTINLEKTNFTLFNLRERQEEPPEIKIGEKKYKWNQYLS